MHTTPQKKPQDVQVTFLDEVRQQPAALQRFIEEAFAETALQEKIAALMCEKTNPQIVLTGMGSSLFACYITQKVLRDHGISACCIESYELQAMPMTFFREDRIIVAVSQSGESPEVLELKQTLPASVPLIVVTNYFNSTLYTMSDLAAGMYAGTEYRTSTKSYTNSLAAMLLLGYRLSGCESDEIEGLKARMQQCVAKMQTLIAEAQLGKSIADFISDIAFLIFVGSGYSYTTASHSEVVAEEAGKFHSSRYTPAQFIHGPIELIYDGLGTVVYDFDRAYSDKCDSVRESVLTYGGKVLLITNRTDVEPRPNQMICRIDHEDPETAILLEVLPLELGIDALCSARGVKTGQLSRVVKRMGQK